jgi:hypothetical protein
VSIATTGGNSNRYDFNVSKHRRWSLCSVGQYNNIIIKLMIIYTLNECETVPNQQYCGNLLSTNTTSGSIWCYLVYMFLWKRYIHFNSILVYQTYITPYSFKAWFDFNIVTKRISVFALNAIFVFYIDFTYFH